MASPTSKCPECGGSGVIVLFTSTKPCPLCAAGKLVEEIGAGAATQAKPCSTFTFTYDAYGRVVAESLGRIDTDGCDRFEIGGE